MRVFRRLFATVAVAGLAATGFVGVASAPAGADAFGYTIQVQPPQGLGFDVSCRLAKVNLATGAVTAVGSYASHTTYACATDLALSPGGQLYGIAQQFAVDDKSGPGESGFSAQNGSEVHLVRFDLTTGAVTDLGAIGTDPAFIANFIFVGGGITFDPAGNLYVYMVSEGTGCGGQAYCLYQVDPANPASVTFKGQGPPETYLFGLTASCTLGAFTSELSELGPSEDVLSWGGGDRLRSVSTTSGASAPVGTGYGDGKYVQSLDFGADGTLYGLGLLMARGFVGLGYLYTVNPTTGTATTGAQISSSSPNTLVQGLAVAPPTCPAPPPEPAPAAVVTPRFTG